MRLPADLSTSTPVEAVATAKALRELARRIEQGEVIVARGDVCILSLEPGREQVRHTIVLHEIAP